MRKLLYLFLLVPFFISADTVFATPLPDIDNPRHIIMVIKSDNNENIHHVLSSANNVLKFYGPEKVEMKIVVYYHGVKALLKTEKEITQRVKTLQSYDVEFIVCQNTLNTKKIAHSALIDELTYVTAGIVEISERIQENWIFINP